MELIKRIDFESGKFTANGNEYIILKSLPVNLFEQMELIQQEVTWGTDFETMFNNLKKAYELLNKSKPMDAGVILYNAMHGIQRNMENREHPVLKLCTLWMIRRGDDPIGWDDFRSKEYIEDWRKEKIDIQDFFGFALSCVQGFMDAFKVSLESFSQKVTMPMNQAQN